MNLRCNNAATVARHRTHSKSWGFARFVPLQGPADREHVCVFLQPRLPVHRIGPGPNPSLPLANLPGPSRSAHHAISPVPTGRRPRTRVRGLPETLPFVVVSAFLVGRL
jgi:hypothetical protein